MNNKFIEKLKAILGPMQVSISVLDLNRCAKDETHGLIPSLPDFVTWPTSHEQVVRIVKTCNEFSVPFTPRGAGTGKSGGCVPLFKGLVIDFSQMNRVIYIDRENLIASVEPGVVLGDFHKKVEDIGLFYPPDPASLAMCTIGGNFAENASGPRALKYGSTRDYVLGTTSVLPNGTVITTGKKTHKGVSGYDLTSLLCGSEGTLALVTALTLKLIPKPNHVQTGVAIFDSTTAAASAVSLLLGSGFLPRCIEYMDKTCILDNPFGLKGRALLLLEVDGDDDVQVMQQLTNVMSILSNKSCIGTLIAQSEHERRTMWDWRRNLSQRTRAMGRFKVSEDIVVPRKKLPELVEALERMGTKYGVKTCAFGHAGDGNLHAQIIYDDESQQENVNELLKELFVETLKLGGTLTGEHGIGIAKMQFLPLEQSEILLTLQKQIKSVFDPRALLNPGKFLPQFVIPA